MLKLQQTLGWVQSVDNRLCVKVSHIGQYRLIRHFFRAISRMGDGMF